MRISQFSVLAQATFFLLVTMALLGASSPALANVLPEGALLLHVQPVAGPDFCINPAITDCSQIVRYTEDSGPVEVDLFVYPLAYENEHLPIQELTTSLEWPESWQLMDWEACFPAQADLQVIASSAELSVLWPSCPPISEQVFLVARFLFDVGGPGMISPQVFSDVVLGCPGDDFVMEAMGIYARAAVDCAYCDISCAHGEYCNPMLEPELLLLEANEGEIVEGEIMVTAVSPTGPGEPCELDCIATAPWMQLAVEELEWPNSRITVTADASTLEEGVYEGWVRVESRCVGCSWIRLNVSGTSGIGDDPTMELTSWGRVKARYR